MDFVFTRGAQGALVGDQNLAKVVNLPGNLRRMYAHMLDFINVCFNTSYMAYWTDHYDDFAPGQSYAGSLSTIGARATYVRNTIAGAGGATAFNVTSSNNLTTASNLVTLAGTAPVDAYTLRINGVEYPTTWSSVSSWSVRAPVEAGSNALVVMAYDIAGNPLTNLSRTISVNYTGAVPEPGDALAINEIMFDPVVPGASYVELFNSADSYAFDLSGWRLDGLSYTFPPGSFIGPRQYLVLAKDLSAYTAAYGTNAPTPFGTYAGALRNDGETLTLIKPGATPAEDLVVDKVRYEAAPPWPVGALGTGSALQLIDPSQDHSRLANWFSDYQDGYTNYGWRQMTSTAALGTVASTYNQFLLFLGEAGDVYIDDLSLVVGTNAGVGQNLIRNGDFEAPLLDNPALTNSFIVPTNYTNTTISTEFKHSGNSSLHLVADSGGSALNKVLIQWISPAPPTASVCTLSFWYLPTTTASNLNVRMRNPGPIIPVVVKPNYVPPAIYATPGSNNFTPFPSLAPIPPLWINEVQPENTLGLQDAVGHRVPWIEIFNSGTNVESLEGLCLANTYTNLTQWAFPTGAVINPGEFKVIFADGATNESTLAELHAGFALAPVAGAVALSRIERGLPRVLDYVNFANVPPDWSYGSYPDGQLFARQAFYRATPGQPSDSTAPPTPVVINEWMAVNTRTLLNTNNDNRYDDWFELHNPSATPASLGGFYLTDNLADKFQFRIPDGFVVPAHGYLLVWADGNAGLNNTNVQELHVNFRLDQGGEQIGLFGGDGVPADSVAFEPQYNDRSQGRFPDATADIYFLTSPTPAAPNSSWANRYPVLPPIPNTNIYLGDTLVLNLAAADPDAPPQTLHYSFAGIVPPGAYLDPATGLFTWTTDETVALGTNALTVTVADDGQPSLSAARTFEVVVLYPFYLSGGAYVESGQFSFDVRTTPGKLYRVEFKDSFDAAEWTPLPPDRLADSTSLTIQDNVGASAQRFYRVREL